eukprot:2546136-Pleurochrysis_carterae.AAC.1
MTRRANAFALSSHALTWYNLLLIIIVNVILVIAHVELLRSAVQTTMQVGPEVLKDGNGSVRLIHLTYRAKVDLSELVSSDSNGTLDLNLSETSVLVALLVQARARDFHYVCCFKLKNEACIDKDQSHYHS